MNEKFLTINLKSFLALILTFILIFAVIAPTALAVSSNESYTEAEQKYEDINTIKGGVLDFSDGKPVDVATLSRTDGIPGRYTMTKNGNNYTITLENVTASKIILPPDVADGDNGKNALNKDEKTGKIAERQTHITIKLIGTNDITGYGLTGYYVKGVSIEGSGSLNINVHKESKIEKFLDVSKVDEKDRVDEKLDLSEKYNYETETRDYIVPGIFVETDEITADSKDTGLVFDNVRVTVTNPYYWGIICNGDIELKNGASLTVKSYTGIKKLAESGDISTDKLFVNEGCTLKTTGKVLIFKQAEQKEVELAREKAKYKDDEQAPTISGQLSDGTNIKEYKTENKVYCEQPTITVTDDRKIDKITVNKETITKFEKGSDDKKKIFVVPSYLDCEKTVEATDMKGNKTEFKFRSNSDHILVEHVLGGRDATCTIDGKVLSKYTCVICKQEIRTEERTIPALGHNLVSTYSEKKCTRCNYHEKIETVTPKAVETPTVTQTPSVERQEVQSTEKNGAVKDEFVTQLQSAPTPSITSSSSSADKKVNSKPVNNKITASNFTKTASTKSQSFKINAKQTGDGELKYESNNKSVAVKAGKVTIKAKFVGKATITITSKATSKYNKATKKITITVKPSKVSVSKLTNSKGKKLTVKWKKNTICGGYQIQVSTDKNFKKNVKTITIKKNSTVSKTITKLSKNKKYYVRIRGYKTVSKVNYYSAWSTVKNIKIKK